METNQEAAPRLRGESRENLRDQLPEHAAHLAAEPELATAWEHELVERKAQASKVESLLEYKARKLEQNQGQHAFTRRAVEKTVTRDAATALGLTEAAVRRLLGTAEFLTEKLPKTWETYRTGVIDRESAAKAAQSVEDIAHREDLLEVIDAEIAERAPGENAAAVQKWVPRRVAELDAAGFQERCDRAHAKRYVTFRHFGNGMSRIEALIPTLVAAQVEQQIHAQARNAPRIAPTRPITGPSDQDTASQERTSEERTLSQRIADAFILRLDTGAETEVPGENADAQVPNSADTNPSSATNLKIGILIPVQTLTGDSDAPAISWDRSWSLPADTIRHIALDPDAEHDWYIAGVTQRNVAEAAARATTADAGQTSAADTTPEILTVVHPRKGPGDQPLQDWIHAADPNSGNLLTRSYQSRTSRDRQRDAILIRDGQCTQIGCTNPGWQSEIDHTIAFETGGHTTGENLKVLCRDCHNIKSHQLDRNTGNRSGEPRRRTEAPARASPTDDDLPVWLIETRQPPDWTVGDAA